MLAPSSISAVFRWTPGGDLVAGGSIGSRRNRFWFGGADASLILTKRLSRRGLRRSRFRRHRHDRAARASPT